MSRGFVYLRESQELMERAAERVWTRYVGRPAASRSRSADRTQEILAQFFYEETRRKPMVIAVPTQS